MDPRVRRTNKIAAGFALDRHLRLFVSFQDHFLHDVGQLLKRKGLGDCPHKSVLSEILNDRIVAATTTIMGNASGQRTDGLQFSGIDQVIFKSVISRVTPIIRTGLSFSSYNPRPFDATQWAVPSGHKIRISTS
jgi:hypothetical protein